MKSVLKPVLLAVVLAGAGLSTFAQGPAMGMHEGMHEQHHRMGKMDPARMQARFDKHSAELKAQLKLTPAQEGAWTTFTAAMKPPAMAQAARPDMEALAKLPTPERIDKMKALHTQRMTEMNAMMDKRGDATKAFYATLNAEQQKVFDANAMRRHGPHGGHAGGAKEAPKGAKAPA
jgi:periplasmic protein CpxP/Spy